MSSTLSSLRRGCGKPCTDHLSCVSIEAAVSADFCWIRTADVQQEVAAVDPCAVRAACIRRVRRANCTTTGGETLNSALVWFARWYRLASKQIEKSHSVIWANLTSLKSHHCQGRLTTESRFLRVHVKTNSLEEGDTCKALAVRPAGNAGFQLSVFMKPFR